MSHNLLLPNRYKKAGWILLLPATLLGVFLIVAGFDALPVSTNVFAIVYSQIFEKTQWFSVISTDVTNTIAGVLFLAGALLVSFSKEKDEDEYIANLRLSSLLWAVFVNYGLLLFAFLFIYGTAFLSVMLYNMFTVLIIFIVRFHYVLYKNSGTATDEKQD